MQWFKCATIIGAVVCWHGSIHAAPCDEQPQIRPADGFVGDEFGHAVDTDGTTIVVGAWRSSQFVENGGAITIIDAETQTIRRTLTPSLAGQGDQVGNAVAVDGPFVVAGAALDDTQGIDAGAVYVTGISAASTVLRIMPPTTDASGGDRFGDDVAPAAQHSPRAHPATMTSVKTQVLSTCSMSQPGPCSA